MPATKMGADLQCQRESLARKKMQVVVLKGVANVFGKKMTIVILLDGTMVATSGGR